MTKDFLDWLEYYKGMSENDFNKLPVPEKNYIIDSYNKDLSYGWQEVKEVVLNKIK